MDDSVPLYDVVHVLKAHKVTVTQLLGRGNTFVVEGNGALEEITLLDQVKKRRLQDLSRKFNIAIHLFWNLDQCPPITEGTIQ